ncbi:unnamed protein product, partial [Meganyctiphanes norvegica]
MSAKFASPAIQENPDGWGPVEVPDQFKDMPYQPFSKGDRLGKVSDWTGNTYQDRRWANKYQSTFGSMQQYAYYHEEDESTFQQVIKSNVPKPMYQRMRFQRNQRYQRGQRGHHGGQRGGQNFQVLGRQNQRRGDKNWAKQQQWQRNRWQQRGMQQKNRDASVTVQPDWKVIEEMDFPRLSKLSLPNIEDPKDLYVCGSLEYYDKAYDRVTVKDEKRLMRINRIFHKVTTTDDPIIRQLYLPKGNGCHLLHTLANILSTFCHPEAENKLRRLATLESAILFIDRRDDSVLCIMLISSTWDNLIQFYHNGSTSNVDRSYSLSASVIAYGFTYQGVRASETQYKFPNPNPFLDEEELDEVAPVGYRYRRWNLGNNVVLVSRTEHDAIQAAPSGEPQFINIKALNEWDSRQSGGVEWRQKLDTQRGAVLANELKNNACKLAKWTVQAMLAGSDQIKFGYASRVNVRDSTKHVILGTQQFKPQEFANQINLSMDNAWGILRCIVDICMKLPDGKFLIMKDPNKAMIRLYDIPDNTFDSEDDDDDDEGGDADGEDEAQKG